MTGIHTKFITLIGEPLQQSYAARLQNSAYEAAGLDLHYFYTETGSEHLREIMDGIRYMPSFAGAAVTSPNKVRVIPFLDELDPLCEKTGACNTVVRLPDGRLRGYNTDGIGFYRSLTEEAGMQAQGKTFFCFGAGGAGRAICSVLAYHGARRIYITSKTAVSREAAANDINTHFMPVAASVENGDLSKLSECDVIINASGVGMKRKGETPLPPELIQPQALYFDACYNPPKTQFLLDAGAAGARTLNGLGMSLYQGAAQIELWSGKKAPVEAMRQTLLEIVNEDH